MPWLCGRINFNAYVGILGKLLKNFLRLELLLLVGKYSWHCSCPEVGDWMWRGREVGDKREAGSVFQCLVLYPVALLCRRGVELQGVSSTNM